MACKLAVTSSQCLTERCRTRDVMSLSSFDDGHRAESHPRRVLRSSKPRGQKDQPPTRQPPLRVSPYFFFLRSRRLGALAPLALNPTVHQPSRPTDRHPGDTSRCQKCPIAKLPATPRMLIPDRALPRAARCRWGSSGARPALTGGGKGTVVARDASRLTGPRSPRGRAVSRGAVSRGAAMSHGSRARDHRVRRADPVVLTGRDAIDGSSAIAGIKSPPSGNLHSARDWFNAYPALAAKYPEGPMPALTLGRVS